MNTEIIQQILSPTVRIELDACAKLVSAGVLPFLLFLPEHGARVVSIRQFVFFFLASAHFLIPGHLINVTLPTSIMAIFNHSASEGE